MKRVLTETEKGQLMWPGLVFAAAAGCAAMLGSAVCAGGGHGSYLPAKLFFPYTMLATLLSDHSIGLPGIVVALIQAPAYVAAVQRAVTRQEKRRVLWVLVAVHASSVIASILLNRNFPEFPPR